MHRNPYQLKRSSCVPSIVKKENAADCLDENLQRARLRSRNSVSPHDHCSKREPMKNCRRSGQPPLHDGDSDVTGRAWTGLRKEHWTVLSEAGSAGTSLPMFENFNLSMQGIRKVSKYNVWRMYRCKAMFRHVTFKCSANFGGRFYSKSRILIHFLLLCRVASEKCFQKCVC